MYLYLLLLVHLIHYSFYCLLLLLLDTCMMVQTQFLKGIEISYLWVWLWHHHLFVFHFQRQLHRLKQKSNNNNDNNNNNNNNYMCVQCARGCNIALSYYWLKVNVLELFTILYWQLHVSMDELYWIVSHDTSISKITT